MQVILLSRTHQAAPTIHVHNHLTFDHTHLIPISQSQQRCLYKPQTQPYCLVSHSGKVSYLHAHAYPVQVLSASSSSPVCVCVLYRVYLPASAPGSLLKIL
ncbi:hypothetical protein QQF64_004144 [Cirrhinus molitorella]|uniref:Uncharacterized protein n=1 Tax=Cirrhinus molitorella TaxID=172907 RepID=A0ABR3MIE4_9TELE